MDNSLALTTSDLRPIVQQIWGRPVQDILNWKIEKFGGGAAEHTGRGLGVYRVAGSARADSDEAPWSAVVKVVGPSDRVDNNDPANSGYWKREVLAYQSGVLEQLPGNVIAPRCYAIQELPNGECLIWLEDIHEADGSWTMEQHQLTARHLGQFNGAYLVGHPLPERASWMLAGRTHEWIEEAPPDKEQLLRFSETDLGCWLSSESVDRMLRLWERRQPLLTALDRLPTCFCHHDAFRRNLLLRQSDDGTAKTVAIDWSYTGPGKLGQEIGITVAVDLQFMDVPARMAQELDKTIFAGYSAGLRDAGWQGDLRLARFGQTVTAALTFGVAFSVIIAGLLQSPDAAATGEAIIGHPIDEIVEQWTEMLPFLLDLGDEALALMPSI
jgi:hypothetical protein